MKRIYLIIIALVLALWLALPTLARSNAAPTTTNYNLSWFTIDGGGAMNVSGGPYSLSSTIGQPDAGAMTGGSYTINSGFWGGSLTKYKVYLPLMLKNF